MVKLKILGIEKSKKYNCYTFTKTQKFFSLVRELLKYLCFDEYEYERFGKRIDKKWGETIYDKEDDIKKYIDKRYSFEEKEYHIDIVFGKDKVFLIAYTEKDRQQKISRFIFKSLKNGV